MLILIYSQSDSVHTYAEQTIHNHSVLHAFDQDEVKTLLGMGTTRVDLFLTDEALDLSEHKRPPGIIEYCTTESIMRRAILRLSEKAN